MKVNCIKCNTENEISAEKLSSGRATISCHKCGNKIKIFTTIEESAESTINVKCQKCNAFYKIPSNKIPKHGAKAVCKKCGNEIWITKNIGEKRTYENVKNETNLDEFITIAPLPSTASCFKLFVGQKYDKYAKKFNKFSKNGKDSYALTWHWPVFFIPVSWFLYRKLYWWAFFAYLFSGIPVFNIVVRFCWAMTGNYIYYKHAEKKIMEAKMEYYNLSTNLKTIGGVNNVIIIIVIAILIFGTITIPTFIAYKEKAIAYREKTSEKTAGGGIIGEDGTINQEKLNVIDSKEKAAGGGIIGEDGTIDQEKLEETLLKIRDQLTPVYEITARDGTFVAYATDVVYDKNTGLEWLAGPDKDMTWDETKSWVNMENLTIDRGGWGWRMPTRDELKTLYRKDAGTRNMTTLLKTTGWWIWSGETKGPSSASGFGFDGDERWARQHWVRHQCRGFAVRSQI